ncbi:HEPN domain-containing protein [Bdellovibrionota bacterium FG-1]
MSAAVNEILRKAEQDLDSAVEIVASANEEKYYQAGFFIQQCVEKSLKAIIIASGGNPQKMHAFGPLLGTLGSLNIDVPSFVFDATEEAMFDMGERYDVPFSGTHDELEKGAASARMTLDWANEIIASIKKNSVDSG